MRPWTTKNNDWLHNINSLVHGCESYQMSGNLVRPKFIPTSCCPDIAPLTSDDNQWKPIIACPADFPVELVLFLHHICQELC